MLQKYNDYSDVIGIVRAQQEGHTLSKGLASHCKAKTIGREVFLSANEKARHI